MNYIAPGMIVHLSMDGRLLSYKYTILKKNENTCTVIKHDTGTISDIEYQYLTIDGLPSHLRSYNKMMRSLNSNQRGKFSKNENIEYKFDDGSKVWFTSDTHFFHDNILRFCNRPFKDIDEMNEVLINNWNSVVGCDDTVFHLGDFAWGGSESWTRVLERLNGHIHLIVGNHDVKNLRQQCTHHFESIGFQKQIEVEGRKIYLNHYPLLTWGGIYRREQDKVWQLFGHVHSNSSNYTGMDSGRLRQLLPIQYDCGVDNNNYKPINFNEIKEIIQERQNKHEKNTIY